MAAKQKLTPTDRGDIARRFGKGVCAAVLAEEFHVTESCIRVTAKKFNAGAGEPKPKLPPAPPLDHLAVGLAAEAGCAKAATLQGPGLRRPGLIYPAGPVAAPQFKDTVAFLCRQAFEEKIKEALDAIFFKP